MSERDTSRSDYALQTAEQLSVALVGRYAVEKEIGAGGMATVYLARDTRHNRRVALKVLKPDLGAALGPERFLTEIQVTANLQHPNLLPLFDSGEVKDARGIGRSLLFYVMPFVEGFTLRERLQREGQLPIDEALRLAAGVAGALDYAHRNGVVHRDLKPENILLRESQPVVMDFGIALAVSNAGGERLTQMGLSLGTPQYMSPEQATGDREVDARSDIYSLAAVLYEMLTGAPPHTGNSLQAIIAKVIVDKPASVRMTRETVPSHVDAAIARALAKLPADRFSTAADFARALMPDPATSPGVAVAQRHETLPAVMMPRLTVAHRVMSHPIARPAVIGTSWLAIVGGAVAAGAAIALAFYHPVTPPYATVPVSIPDSIAMPSIGRSVAVSADGSRIAIAASSSAQSQIYGRRMNAANFAALHGTLGGRSPAFSPNGEQIIFVAGGKLSRVSAEGGVTLPLADSTEGQHSWGDDDRVVFIRRGSIWSVPSAGGAARLVASADTARGQAYGWPDVLPGAKAALITIRGGRSSADSNHLGVVDLAAGGVTDLGIVGTGGRYAKPGYIVFGTVGGSLWAVPFDARKRAVTGAKVQLASGAHVDSTGAADVAVSALGTLIYGERAGVSPNGSRMRVQLAVVDRTGSAKRTSAQIGDFYSPRVSPDGSMIAITEGEGGPRTDVWIFEIATGKLTPMTRQGYFAYPEWADAKNIVFRDGSSRQFVIQPADLSADIKTFYVPPPMNVGGSPAWNLALGPGGKPRAIMRQRTAGASPNRQDIGRIDSTGSEGPFVTTLASEVTPRVSPNGKWLAYSSNESGTYQIYVLPMAGGPRVPVSVEHGIEPVWSRDGKVLYYVARNLLLGAHVDEARGFHPTTVDTLFSFAEKGFIINPPPGRGPTRGFYDVFANGDFVILTGGQSVDETRASIVALLHWPQLMVQSKEQP